MSHLLKKSFMENFIFCAVIDLFLTNLPRSFYQTETFFTGLSDFPKRVLSIFKTTFTKSKAKKKKYIYIYIEILRNSMNNAFKIDRRTELSSKSIKSYGSFENIFLNH